MPNPGIIYFAREDMKFLVRILSKVEERARCVLSKDTDRGEDKVEFLEIFLGARCQKLLQVLQLTRF